MKFFRFNILVSLLLTILLSSCAFNKPPYDLESDSTGVIWCPEDSTCSRDDLYLKETYSSDIFPHTTSELFVYHGAYCVLLETRTVTDYRYLDENLEERVLTSPIDVYNIECTLGYKRNEKGKLFL